MTLKGRLPEEEASAEGGGEPWNNRPAACRNAGPKRPQSRPNKSNRTSKEHFA